MSKTVGLNERAPGPKERIKYFWDREEKKSWKQVIKRDDVGLMNNLLSSLFHSYALYWLIDSFAFVLCWPLAATPLILFLWFISDKCICSGDASTTNDWLSCGTPKICGEQKTDKSFIISVQFSVSSAVRRLRLDRNPKGPSQNGAGLGALNTTVSGRRNVNLLTTL